MGEVAVKLIGSCGSERSEMLSSSSDRFFQTKCLRNVALGGHLFLKFS